MLNLIKKKIDRLFSSSKILKINFFFHKYFGEKDIGNIGFYFKDKPNRFEIIQEIIFKKKYKSYLEIGCFANEVFTKIQIEKKVGVDPVSGGTIKKTSDEFFKNNKEYFDCIFIDGLHEYKQVKRDINNSIKFLNKNGIILLHDCLPNNVYDQAMPRCQYNWNGNVWKAIVECRTRNDIDVYTCYADNGIGVIFNKQNFQRLDVDIKNFSKLKFSDYFYNHKKWMNIISYEELIKKITN
tara:strand:- start:3020 stop:3736 length:717 start_codon:yes stop_codon:yes gene_type:complete